MPMCLHYLQICLCPLHYLQICLCPYIICKYSYVLYIICKYAYVLTLSANMPHRYVRVRHSGWRRGIGRLLVVRKNAVKQFPFSVPLSVLIINCHPLLYFFCKAAKFTHRKVYSTGGRVL